MNRFHDPELYDALEGDRDLVRIAELLASTPNPDPPLDTEFRSRLRRQLMDQAWDTVEDRRTWWREMFTPQRMAWASAAAVVVLVASVVLFTAAQPTGPNFQEVIIQVPQEGQTALNLQQPIQVKFNQAMDHRSTEAAVQITPATTVDYSWNGDTLLNVQPTSGNLAPNTQYQVTIRAGARTQSGTTTTAPQTFSFVTNDQPQQPAPSPSPVPTPSANTGLLSAVAELTPDYPPSGTVYPVVWSSDSSTVFFVGANGALESIAVKEGAQAKTLVAGGVSLPALDKAGDRLAYVRDGKIETLDVTSGTTTDLQVDAAPTALGWVDNQLYWASSSGVSRLEGARPVKLADLPAAGATVISIAPDGRHAIVRVADSLVILSTSTGKAASLCGGGCGGSFEGWSPDGSRIVYGANGINDIADVTGNVVSSTAQGDASWSTFDEVLLGTDTGVFEARPDGSDPLKLADGTFRSPVWAPDATTFAFVRGAQLWVATAPPPVAAPPATDQALRVVKQFMQARLDGQSQRANLFLDNSGQAAYAGTTPALIPQGSPGLKRYYVLTSEVDPATHFVHVVVRLVFAHGKIEDYSTEEALTLVRAQATDPYLIDAVTAGPQIPTGKGPEVVSVRITPAELDVTFDSDLQLQSITNVSLQDADGARVSGTLKYSDRTVSVTGLQLTPGARYRLVVLPAILDVGNQNAAAEYDLDLIGPAAAPLDGGVTPSPSPSSSPSPSPSPSPSATASPSPSPAKKKS